MSKKRIAIARMMASLMLAMALCIGTALPAFAAENTYASGSEEKPAKAAITKILKMPAGTNTPGAKFTFKFKPVSVDDKPDNGSNMPAFKDIDIVFNGSEADVTEGGVRSVVRESGNIIDSLAKPWPHAGIYKYTVTELGGTYAIVDGDKEWMTYSKASYDIEVIVENGEKGLYVAYITATRKLTEDGEEIKDGEKVNPTPGGNGVEYKWSQMIFTNTYAKTNGGGEKNPKLTVLEIGKEVTGMGANRDLYFKFEVAATKPAVGFEGKTPAYIAYVVDAAGNNVTSADNYTPLGTGKNGSYILFKSGEALTVGLKHGQKLAFVDLPVGSGFTVNEQAAEFYTAKYTLVLDGKTPVVQENTDINAALAIPGSSIGEKQNSVAYLNTRLNVTPTGISVDNLPFVIIIGLAALGLIGYAVAKSRRRARYWAYEQENE